MILENEQIKISISINTRIQSLYVYFLPKKKKYITKSENYYLIITKLRKDKSIFIQFKKI